MPHNLKIASIGQPEYKVPLYETDLDDLYENPTLPDRPRSHARRFGNGDWHGGRDQFRPGHCGVLPADFISNDVLPRITGPKIGNSTEPCSKYISGTFLYTSDSIKRLKLLTRVAVHQLDCLFHYDQASLGFLELMGLRVSRPFRAAGSNRGLANCFCLISCPTRNATFRRPECSSSASGTRLLNCADITFGRRPSCGSSTIGAISAGCGCRFHREIC